MQAKTTLDPWFTLENAKLAHSIDLRRFEDRAGRKVEPQDFFVRPIPGSEEQPYFCTSAITPISSNRTMGNELVMYLKREKPYQMSPWNEMSNMFGQEIVELTKPEDCSLRQLLFATLTLPTQGYNEVHLATDKSRIEGFRQGMHRTTEGVYKNLKGLLETAAGNGSGRLFPVDETQIRILAPIFIEADYMIPIDREDPWFYNDATSIEPWKTTLAEIQRRYFETGSKVADDEKCKQLLADILTGELKLEQYEEELYGTDEPSENQELTRQGIFGGNWTELPIDPSHQQKIRELMTEVADYRERLNITSTMGML